MKILLSLLVVVALSIAATYPTANQFDGTYNGLTENMEFEFTNDDGETLLFQEYDEAISFDLYEDEFVGVRFKVSWEEREVEEYDEETEETVVKIVNVITDLKKL
jgi:hypothetical protein